MTRTDRDGVGLSERVINGVSDKVAALRSARGHHAAERFNRDHAERLARLNGRHDHQISEIPNPTVRDGVRRHVATTREMS